MVENLGCLVKGHEEGYGSRPENSHCKYCDERIICKCALGEQCEWILYKDAEIIWRQRNAENDK